MTLSPAPKRPAEALRPGPPRGGFRSSLQLAGSACWAPSPPRFIGHSTCTSRIGSSPNRAGMRLATISRSLARRRPPRSRAAGQVEVAAGRLAGLGQQTPVDPVRVGDDPALGGLAEHSVKPHHRHRPGADDVSQHCGRRRRPGSRLQAGWLRLHDLHSAVAPLPSGLCRDTLSRPSAPSRPRPRHSGRDHPS